VPRVDRPSRARLAAWEQFLRSHLALVDRLDRDLVECHGLPLAWYDVLVQLEAAGGESTMGALASNLLIAPSSCTRIVERMTASGLVERRTDDHDHRVRHARLTPDGRSTLKAAARTHLAGIERYFGAFLSDAEAAVLSGRFEAMRRSADH
jgi:DNA-binding MarR family transcriptional regulator